MPEQNPRKIHIYFPLMESPYSVSNWAEQVLGLIVKPLYREFKESIDWLWIGRYGTVNDDVPDRYRDANNDRRFLALRLLVRTNDAETLEQRALELVQAAQCWTPPEGWVDLDIVEELGTDRYLYMPEGASNKKELQVQRAQLIVDFLDATTKLILDCIQQNDSGEWLMEPNADELNPNGTMFQSVLHLFCNATAASIPLEIGFNDMQLKLGTIYRYPQVLISLAKGSSGDFRHIPVAF